MKLAVMSLRKHPLRVAASSARKGGTRRVFTSPLRGALAMTARAQTSVRSAKPTDTRRSLPFRAVARRQRYHIIHLFARFDERLHDDRTHGYVTGQDRASLRRRWHPSFQRTTPTTAAAPPA